MNILKKSQEKVNNPSFILKAIFWALVVVFTLIVGYITIPIFGRYIDFYFIIVSGIIFFLLGIALIFLSVKERIDRLLKKFLILIGTSAIGLVVSVLLYNPIFNLFIRPFSFFFATFVCPIAFLVGAIGSIILFIRKK